MQIHLITIQFPEIKLQTRDAHKLRGYFGNIFKEHSPLLHNHFETGELRYQYPLVQYKVLDGIPTLVAIQEGAKLLTQLFLKIKHITIQDYEYEVKSKNIKSEMVSIGFSEELEEYRFQTLWMSLNQANHLKYTREEDSENKKKMLNKIITGNVLSFYKGIGIYLEPHQKLMAKCKLTEKTTRFKDKEMVAFMGNFVINAHLPSGIGLGKAVSRGFGSIRKI